jgi:hypothetical protein
VADEEEVLGRDAIFDGEGVVVVESDRVRAYPRARLRNVAQLRSRRCAVLRNAWMRVSRRQHERQIDPDTRVVSSNSIQLDEQPRGEP